MTPSEGRLGLLSVSWPVLLVAGLFVVALLALAGAYGFHGDEMYFVVAGQHPAFGYVDQPPLTPLLSAASVALLGVTPTAVRVLPAIEMGLIVILTALIARDLGGSRRAQMLAAITAALSGYLGAGHLDTTTDPDLLAWAIIVWLLVKLLAGGDRRLWLALGVTTGIGLENKDTLLFLGAGLAVGLVLTRRWDVIRSPWSWAAIGIALLIWAPNLAWQATNGWPQLTMAQAISGYAADNRAQVVPLLWLFTGPLLFPVSAAGLVWVLFVEGGCSVASDRDRRTRRTRSRLHQRRQGVLRHRQRAAVHGGRRHRHRPLACPWSLPHQGDSRRHRRAAVGRPDRVVDPADPPDRRLREVRTRRRRSPTRPTRSGGPQFVSTVEGVVASLPADQRDHAVILTNDYSEASPLDAPRS